jgi:hypothetical protein
MSKDTPKDTTAAGDELDAAVDAITEVAAEALLVEAPAPAAAPAPAEQAEFPLTLAEACARISANDRRVEMIGAFHSSEKAAGRLKDLESAYRTRFAAFCNAPA